jgi:hypothetical protein
MKRYFTNITSIKAFALWALIAVGHTNFIVAMPSYAQGGYEGQAPLAAQHDLKQDSDQQLRHRQAVDHARADSKKSIRVESQFQHKLSVKKLLIVMLFAFLLFFAPTPYLTPNKKAERFAPPELQTATIFHALGYCKTEPECISTCMSPQKNEVSAPSTQTKVNASNTSKTLCALDYIMQTSGKEFDSPYLHATFDTVLKRSQMHPDYIEFFHAYQGTFEFLFDIMTEIAQRLYGDPHNPSPFFLRILSEDFKKGGKNTHHFLKETWPLCLGPDSYDHDTRVQAVIISTNMALTGNLGHKYECTLSYFLHGMSLTLLTWDFIERLLEKFNLRPELVEELEFITQYLSKQGQLLQIFVPQRIVDNCAYLSLGLGFPLPDGHPLKNLGFVDAVKTAYATGQYKISNDIELQARLLLNPRYAKHFIVYRYPLTPWAAEASREVSTRIHALFDKEFARLGHEKIEVLGLIERILQEEDGAREQGFKKLAELPAKSSLPKPLCEALELSPKKYVDLTI